MATTSQRKVLTGNAAAAHAVMLCQPDVIAAYPITPSTEILDILYGFQADGSIKSQMVEPEGEHSAMSILIGASICGGRTFTPTSSQGLFFMYEACIFAAAHRLPIVMVNVNRETTPAAVASSGQDIHLVKDNGWIQMHSESGQEILDMIIMAFRLAEDPDILVPITIAYDGYYLSYRSEAVDIPSQEQVDRFLPPRRIVNPIITPDAPMTMQPGLPTKIFTEYRIKHMQAMQMAMTKLDELEREFACTFGRSYPGVIEEYRCDDAEIVLLTLGSCAGTAKVTIDRKREEGIRVGMVRVRMYRPFPKEQLAAKLKGKKAIGVIDRDVSFGWNCGHLFVEAKAALNDVKGKRIPMLNFIGGLNGADITLKQMAKAIDDVNMATQRKAYQHVTFFEVG
jgi:phenylglyoxylate dehydrogenase alpha subunit